MTTILKRYTKGIALKGETVDITDNVEGSLFQNSSELRLKAYIEGAVRQIVTNTQSQVLTNKTIDADNNTVSNIQTSNLKAGVLNTDTSLTGASNTQLPSALAVKTYVDTKAAAQNEASEISFAPAGTIVATTVQAMGQELDGDIQGHITSISGAHAGSAISNTPSGNLAATNVQAALNELQSDVDTRATSTDLTNHTTASANVHGIGVGNSVVGTGTSQALTNKTIDADLNTISNIDNADIKVGAAIDAAKIANGLVSNTEFQYLDGVTSAIQTQINSKVNASGGTLTSGSIVTPVRSDVKQDTKANLTTYATTASNGQLVFATDTKEMFQVVDGLLEAVGGGAGIGGVDILFAQTFEEAALTDFTQTGLSLSTSSPLHGEVSALMTHQNAVNQSFKQVIPVDAKFRGQAMTMRLNVKSNAPAGDVTLNIYDETNAANIVASEQLQLSNDTAGALNKVGFTIPATCTSLSYTITALPEAGSPVTRVDDIIAELAVTSLLETSVTVPVVTEWQGYTPTFQGFGTPTAVEFEWRQVGQDVEIRGKFTSGTPTAVEARVGLPGGLTSAGTALIPSLQIVGNGGRNALSDQTNDYSILIEPSVSFFNLGVYNSSTTNHPLSKANGTHLINLGEVLSFFAKVPCAGLSATSTKTIDLTQSGLVQNPDSMIRVYGPNGAGSTGTRVLRFLTLASSLGSDITYTDSATNGASFTANTSGVYSFSGYFVTQQSLTQASCGLTLNASGADLSTNVTSLADSKILTLARDSVNTATTASKVIEFSWTGYLNAGDVVRVQNDGESIAGAQLTSTKESSLKQVSVSSDQKIKIPTSELRFEGASTRGSTATAIVRFDSVAKIRGDAFTVVSDAVNGTAITMTKAGSLAVTSSFSANICTMSITKNQAVLTTVPTASEAMASHSIDSNGNLGSVSAVFDVAVGDIIRIQCSQTPSANSGNNLNLSFQEQDIAVSVTNTLPQFSESDSCVQTSGANGFGSTSTLARRFANVIQNVGTDIEYTDSPTLGGQFKARTAGIYHISYTERTTASSTYNGLFITKNASETLATSGDSINTANTNEKAVTVSWSGYLNVNDVITGTVNSQAQNNGNIVIFTISKVGKPNVTGVDVTPFVKIPQNDVDRIETIYEATTALLDTTAELRFDPAVFVTRTNKGIITVEDDSTNTRTKFVALKRCNVHVSFTAAASTIGGAVLYKNGSTYFDASYAPAGNFSTLSAPVSLEPGEFISLQRTNITAGSGYTIKILAEAASDSIITASESFSTDTASLQYAGSGAYTLATLANAPVGTFITFTYASSGNVRTQTTVAPTQTTADMNTNGIQIFTRAYNAASTAASPASVAIQIGKGLKGVSLNLYKSTGKTTSGTVDFYQSGTATVLGFRWKDYNETTGILLLDAGGGQPSAITSALFEYTDQTAQTSGYLVINASKSPALVGVPLLQPRIALVSNVLASNASTQVIPGSTWTTVNINTLNDPSGVVTGLASNQISLLPGQYYFESFVSLLSNSSVGTTNGHTRIRNITAGSTSLSGHKVQFINLANVTDIPSLCQGYVTITTPSVFEIQTFLSSGAGGNIGGASVADTSENKTPVLIKITKVK